MHGRDWDRTGVLVIGHGTRDSAGQMQMRNLACQTAGCLSPLPTELGFLELAEPSIDEGMHRLANAGVKRVITVPVLLFRAGHADRDIPEAVAAAANRYDIEPVYQSPPLEHQPTLIELSAERFRQSLQSAGLPTNLPPRDIALVMIARGSSSQSAADAMERLAELRARRAPVREYRVGFVAVRQPTVEQSLDWLGGRDCPVLVVQPHLLFEGEVYNSLLAAVAQRQAGDSRRWIVCRPLGATSRDFEDVRLARVLAELAAAWPGHG